VLFVDLASFTSLTATMGDQTAADVLRRFSNTVRTKAIRHRGRIVKQIGDAFMLMFTQPTDAIEFGLAMAHFVDAEPQFPALHIGAHQGTVLYREGDYLGGTVNLAARVAAAGAAFAISTLGGYLLSLWVGLFGFTEVRTTAGIVAGIIDIAAFATLALAAAPGLPAGLNLGRRMLPVVAGASVVALALLFAAVATPRTPPVAAGANVLKARVVGGVNLLTNANGLTLYWFAPDTSAKSVCYGSCAAYWPPVTGSPSAGPGVTGTLGTISRTDGTVQATYDGHPLYTYIGDSAPGQASGNNLNLNGGLWHDVPVTG